MGLSFVCSDRFVNVEQMIERLNWMADRSVKGLLQSGGIMVNYIYRYSPFSTVMFGSLLHFTFLSRLGFDFEGLL